MTQTERLDIWAWFSAVGIGFVLGATTVWWVGLCTYLAFLIVDHWVHMVAGAYEDE